MHLCGRCEVGQQLRVDRSDAARHERGRSLHDGLYRGGPLLGELDPGAALEVADIATLALGVEENRSASGAGPA